jgi:ABC-type nickel/cobalt efflux system permease component RcnA
MTFGPQLLLVGAVAAVGVLHTIVPDHWVPIALIARQRGWSKAETARASLLAGTGHVLSTLSIALVVWLANVAVAKRFGPFVDMASSMALIAFGGWIAISAWWEMRRHGGHANSHTDGKHGHTHREHEHTHREHGHAHDELGLDRRHRPEHARAPADDPLYAPLRGETLVLTRHIHTQPARTCGDARALARPQPCHVPPHHARH